MESGGVDEKRSLIERGWGRGKVQIKDGVVWDKEVI